tara:strand:- start:1608 stop:2273 length:666 start_codon:yes stop_codon:yes gene_type:complete
MAFPLLALKFGASALSAYKAFNTPSEATKDANNALRQNRAKLAADQGKAANYLFARHYNQHPQEKAKAAIDLSKANSNLQSTILAASATSLEGQRNIGVEAIKKAFTREDGMSRTAGRNIGLKILEKSGKNKNAYAKIINQRVPFLQKRTQDAHEELLWGMQQKLPGAVAGISEQKLKTDSQLYKITQALKAGGETYGAMHKGLGDRGAFAGIGKLLGRTT